MATEAQRRAVARYDGEHTVQVKMKLNKESDADILSRLATEPNKQGFIKAAIRSAMGKTQEPEKREKEIYLYGMRARYFSIGAQPKEGLLGAIDPPDGRWYNVICYSRPLTAEEVRDYELDDLNG